jgi:hypothetical protein
MANNYTVRLFNAYGAYLADLQFARLEYVLAENAVSTLVLTLPPVISFDEIGEDARLEVWRSVDGAPAYLEGSGGDGTVWFVNKKELRTRNDETLIVITATDAKSLLRRRIVDYSSGSSQSTKSGPLDNVCKAIVRENLGSSSYTGALAQGRDISAYLSVQADVGLWPSNLKSFAWQNVFQALVEICEQSAGDGAYGAFDIVKTGSQLEFRTYYSVRGLYRGFGASNLVLVSDKNGTLTDTSIIYDWSNSSNYIRVGGSGEGTARYTGQFLNSPYLTSSPFSRRELFVDARNGGIDQTEVNLEAIREGFAARPKLRVSAKVINTESVKYGVHYQHGDVIACQIGSTVLNTRVVRVRVVADENGELVESSINNETVL